MLLNSPQIAAVIRARLASIMRAGRPGRLIIEWITVRKTVRHYLVDHVVQRQSLVSTKNLRP